MLPSDRAKVRGWLGSRHDWKPSPHLLVAKEHALKNTHLPPKGTVIEPSVARTLWQFHKGVTYLNHGAFGCTPLPVLNVQRELLDSAEGNPMQWMTNEPQRLTWATRCVAKNLKVSGLDVAIVPGVTNGYNTITRSFPWTKGDVVVTFQGAYPTLITVLQFLERTRGIKLIQVPFSLPTSKEELLATAKAALDTHKPRMFVVDHITSLEALVLPVKEIVEMCKARAVVSLVDGAHSYGNVPLDVGDVDPDFWTGNLHKWGFAPRGTGYLYCNPRWQKYMLPAAIGFGHGEGFASEFMHGPTKDSSLYGSIPAATMLFDILGGSSLIARNRSVAREALQFLSKAWGHAERADRGFLVRGKDAEEMLGSMVTVRVPERPDGVPYCAEDAGKFWKGAREGWGVEARFLFFANVGGSPGVYVRLCVHAHVGMDDIRILAQAVQDIVDGVKRGDGLSPSRAQPMAFSAL